MSQEGGLDEVLDEVYDWICDFVESDYFGRLGPEQQDIAEDVLLLFTEYMYRYHGLQPEEWSERQVEVCCLETISQKLAAEETYFRAISPVLALFFRFAGEAGFLQNGAALAGRVQKIGRRIVDNALNPALWGATKTFAMAAVRAGVDLTDAAEMDRFLVHYKKMLARKFERTATASRPHPQAEPDDPRQGRKR